MTPDEIKWRRCQMPGCDYKELRGSSLGQFVSGKFVCDVCYTEAVEPSEVTVRRMRTEDWPERQ